MLTRHPEFISGSQRIVCQIPKQVRDDQMLEFLTFETALFSGFPNLEINRSFSLQLNRFSVPSKCAGQSVG